MTTREEQRLFEQGKSLLGKLRLYRTLLLNEKKNRQQYEVLIEETKTELNNIRKQLFEDYKIYFTTFIP